MEKLLPRPVRPHGEGGEQSVRSPPATVGHICGQLSPLQQSEPLCILAYLCALLLSPRLFLCLTRSNPTFGYKRSQKTDILSSLVAVLLPRLFILMGGVTHEKESPSLQERSRRMGHISRAVHTPATVNDFHPLAPSHSGLLTVKPGERGTHTFIINKGNICFTNQPSPD